MKVYRTGNSRDKAWIRQPNNHLPFIKLNSYQIALKVQCFHSTGRALIEKGHRGRNQDSDKAVLAGYCQGCRDEE